MGWRRKPKIGFHIPSFRDVHGTFRERQSVPKFADLRTSGTERNVAPSPPRCAWILKAATDAGRGRLTLLVRGKATVDSTFGGPHTPRIFLSARSARKPVVEHYHAEGCKERQSHC